MSDDNKSITANEVNAAIKELRETVESVKKDSLDEAKINRITKLLDSQDELSQKLVATQEEAKSKEEATQARIDLLEKQLSAPGAEKDSARAELDAEIKAFGGFIARGEDKLSADEMKFLRSDVSADGGVLAPAEVVNTILKDITETSNLRSIATVRTAGAGRIEIPIRTSLVVGGWLGQGSTGTDSNSKYGDLKINLEKINVTTPISIEELQDASFNMEAEIGADISEEFARLEGLAFIKGLGSSSNQPEGVMTNTAITVRNTTSAAALTMDSILQIAGDIKTGYDPVYIMNRKTVAETRILKDTNGQYHWMVGNIAAGVPNTLNGHRYIEIPDMDDVAANAFPIAFGDFRRGYLIGDRAGLTVIRDPFTLKKQGLVEFTFTRRVGAAVVKPEAIKKLKVAV